MVQADRTESPIIPEFPSSPPVAENPASPKTYNDQLKQDFHRIFAALPLSPLQREFLSARWLDQLLWMEGKAARCRDRHQQLRLISIILGVLVPILVSVNTSNERYDRFFKNTAIVFSSMVALSSAVEEFFHYGERWYAYRRASESLKAQGWQFFQLRGPYRNYSSHQDAFGDFVENIEEIIQRDVEVYSTQNKNEKTQQQSDQNQ